MSLEQELQQAGFKPIQRQKSLEDELVGGGFSPKETQQPEEEKEGFFKTFAKEAIRTPARVGVSAFNLAKQTFGLGKALLAGESQVKDEMVARDLPFLGKTEPILTGREKTGEGLKKIVGSGAELGSWVVGGGGGSVAARQTFKGLIKQGVKTGIKTGVPAGITGAGGKTLAEGGTVGEAGVSGALGGLTGGLLGGATGGLLPLAGAGLGIGARLVAQPIKTLSGASNSLRSRATSLGSFLAEVSPEAATQYLLKRPKVQKAIVEGITPEQILSKTRGAVRNYRTKMSTRWENDLAVLKDNYTDQTFGLNGDLSKNLYKIADDFPLELDKYNLDNLSVEDSINLAKDVNELFSRKAVREHAKGSIVRKAKDELKTSVINNFGGKDGDVAVLWKNYSAQKGAFDAINDLVNAFNEGRPIKTATAQGRLMSIFNNDREAYLQTILDFEEASGQDIVSGVLAQTFGRTFKRDRISPIASKTDVLRKLYDLIVFPIGKGLIKLGVPTLPRKARPPILDDIIRLKRPPARLSARTKPPKTATKPPTKKTPPKFRTKPPAEVAGALGGIEFDEEGKVSFDPKKAAIGIGAMAGLSRLVKSNVSIRTLEKELKTALNDLFKAGNTIGTTPAQIRTVERRVKSLKESILKEVDKINK